MSNNKRHFTAAETNALSFLVDMIIPASEDLSLPSAGDTQIFAEILKSAERQGEKVRSALSDLDAVAYEEVESDFSESEVRKRAVIIELFRRAYPQAADLLATITMQCYYRDGRVMQSLKMETRAPYPRGFEVDQGNWALLDTVRNRTPIFRNPP